MLVTVIKMFLTYIFYTFSTVTLLLLSVYFLKPNSYGIWFMIGLFLVLYESFLPVVDDYVKSLPLNE